MSYTVDLSTVPTTELAAPAVGVIVLDQQGYGPPGPPGPQGEPGAGGIPSAHAPTHASGGSDPVTLDQSQITGLTAALAAKATDTAVVHTTGNESVAGAKTFTTTTQVPYMGVGTSPSNDRLMNISGAPPGTQPSTYGVTFTPMASITTTSTITGIYARIDTAAASFTCNTGVALQIVSPNIGAGSTLSTLYGIQVYPQTAGATGSYGVAVGAASTATLWLDYTANNTTSNAGIAFGASRDTNLYRSAANTLKTDDKLITALGLGVGNSAAAATPGTVVRKMEVFDAAGTSLGFVPIYNTIT
jgi:hypothetical protein